MKPATDRKLIIPHRVFSDRVESVSDAPDLRKGLALYRQMLLARRSDELERELVTRGEAFFQLSCSGHEAMAAFAYHLEGEDWLHLHYRDKALLLARGVPLHRFFDSVLCNARSCSAGRQMAPFLSDRQLRILAQNIPVGNHALQAVGVAAAARAKGQRAIVLCTMGDGATQQGEVLEAIAEAVRDELPILFVVEDNGYAISTTTAGRTFFSLPGSAAESDSYLGLPIHRLDGCDPLALESSAGALVRQVRETRKPHLAVVRFERLCNHTNADDERVYRPDAERAGAAECGDPISRLAGRLVLAGVPEEALAAIDAGIRLEVQVAAEQSLAVRDPSPIATAKAPMPAHLTAAVDPIEPEHSAEPRQTMLEAIRGVLRSRLESDRRVSLLGQDIEDPKGDVFGVTRGLSRAYPERVRNAALSESTIIGTAIGRALAGERPVAFLQFADFLPLAFNQILSEMGSMQWRTAGQWSCPVVVMVACGGYRPGLGPFHAQTMESVLAHVPGIDVFMPAGAADAAGLLNAAFESGRPTVFLYPKCLLNDPDRATSIAVDLALVRPGEARRLHEGNDLTIATWGSTIRQCEQATEALSAAGIGVDLLDLRTISPWDEDAVCESAGRTGRLLVVHEDNQTCGFGAEVVATVVERLGTGVSCRRVTRPDTFVPCNFANQLEILPSFKRVVEAAAGLLGLDVSWKDQGTTSGEEGRLLIEAHGPSPADQRVTVLEWMVKRGQAVQEGERLAELEADKAVFELVAPADGTVVELHVTKGQTVRVGAPLLELAGSRRADRVERPTRERVATPVLERRKAVTAPMVSRRVEIPPVVGLSSPAVALGSMRVGNDEILERFPGRTTEDILKRTGIESRRRLGPGESALSLAVQAAGAALEASGIGLDAIDSVICSTTTPPMITPSMACLVLEELGRGRPHREIPAHDVLAACSGYLYSLAAAYDLTRSRPDARVLVITAEALSPMVDPDDFDTAILFGDAATATVVSGPEVRGARPFARLRRPYLAARGEAGVVLRVPVHGDGYLAMNSLKVYAEAVRGMLSSLEKACAEAGMKASELDLVVPHQANARIMNDIRVRLKLPPDRMVVTLGETGNTSSSSIPLALTRMNGRSGDRVGLTAFGGGYTLGAAVLEIV